MGILGGKTSGYFLTSECSGHFRFISDYVLAMSVIGLAAPDLPHKFLTVYPFPVGFLLPV